MVHGIERSDMGHREREISAHHESAHVVIAWHFGYPAQKVQVQYIPGDDSTGKYTLKWLHHIILRNVFTEKYGMIILAGNMFQEMRFPGSRPSVLDRCEFEKFIPKEEQAGCVSELKRILSEPMIQKRITKLAEEINEKRILNADDIRAILE